VWEKGLKGYCEREWRGKRAIGFAFPIFISFEKVIVVVGDDDE